MLNNDLHALLYDGADAFYRINPVNNAVKLFFYLISYLIYRGILFFGLGRAGQRADGKHRRIKSGDNGDKQTNDYKPPIIESYCLFCAFFQLLERLHFQSPFAYTSAIRLACISISSLKLSGAKTSIREPNCISHPISGGPT